MKKILFAVFIVAFLTAPALALTSLDFSTTTGTSFTLSEIGGTWTLSFATGSLEVDATNPSPDAVYLDLVDLPTMTLGPIVDDGTFITATLTPSGDVTITPDTGGPPVMTASIGSGATVIMGFNYIAYSLQIDDLAMITHASGYSTVIDDFATYDAAGLAWDISFTGQSTTNLYAMLKSGTGSAVGTASGQMSIVPASDCQLEVTKEACVIVPGGNQCFKGNKIKSMILEYTGQGCGASSHSQEPKKVKCSGDPSGAEPVDIFVTDKKLTKNWGSALNIPIGGVVLADAANAGKDNLDSETLVRIYNANTAVLIQEVIFHTSCSQPLAVGDQFGSMLLTSLTTTEGGTVGSDTCSTELPATGADVEYTYTITNTGAVTVTNVTVNDDVFGVVPGSPIPSILPGETVVLTLIESLGDATTNTVVVTAAEGCRAEATATITKAPPEPEECTTKIQAMLLEYIGPTVSGPVTVTIKADKFKADLVSYNFGGDLVSGTPLSSVAENDWTIDATAHTTTDKKGNVKQCVELGSKTEISINGVKEVIHTSCSTPFVSGAPAPLDNPKGDPSPNWFVVDFRQK